MRFLNFLERMPKYLALMLSFFLVFLFAAVDYITAPDLSTFIFYLVPVFLATWFIGKKTGFAVSVLSAFAWTLADLLSLHVYSYALIPYWNLATEVGFFLLVVYILSTLKISLQQEKQMARTDFLTGAVNSRHLSELAEVEIKRARRYGHPFTVGYMDVDNFKVINDLFGHNAGDALLMVTVKTIRDHVRETDIIARMGGDEFVLLFPETGFETAQIVLNKIRVRLAEVMQEHKWPVTFSFGMATFLAPPESVDPMIRLVDRLMFEAKNNGKNRVRHERYEGLNPAGNKGSS